MPSAVIYLLVYAGIAARIAALLRAVSSRVLASHVCFCAMTLLSLALAAVSAAHNLGLYRSFYNATLWPLAILEAAALVEAFWIMARHFRNIRGFGWALAGVIAGISVI